MKSIKVSLEKTTRSDLICIACGGFLTEFAIVASGVSESVAGVHRECIAAVHVKRTKSAVNNGEPHPSKG